MQEIETLIVGGGMAGLGAARTLRENGYDRFLLASDKLGGRVLSSTDGEVNYGAFYVRTDYKHISPFVSRKRKLAIRSSLFISEGKKQPVFSVQNLLHCWPALRLVVILYIFAWRYRLLRTRCEYMSPSQALSKDHWLNTLYKQNAQEFIQHHGLTFWSKRFLSPMITATTFVEPQKVSAASMLVSLLPVVLSSWQFTLHKEKIIKGIEDKIQEGIRITFVKKESASWVVEDANGESFRSRYLILALPISETKRLLSFDKPINTPRKARVLHIQGTLKEMYRGYHLVFFSQESPVIWIADAGSGNYLFYPKDETYALEEYFTEHKVVHDQKWDPAFFLGTAITDIDQEDGLYIIGGHNFASMEDAYISGIYAANQVLTKA